ncbi:hypothetical protein B0H21DRAFT_542786 [Amylocystis lapponica]|nr:hypothetical protein B0H21DRAFT_542786 [Amylocystis lapponica]
MGAYTINRIPIQHEAIDGMIKLYDQITALSWPAEWHRDLPTVDDAMYDLRSTLFCSVKKSAANTVQTVLDRVTPRLSAVLHVTNNALACRLRPYMRGALERGGRFSWDELLNVFCADEDSHLVPLLDQELRMPRTKALDCARHSTEAWYTFRLAVARQHNENSRSAMQALFDNAVNTNTLEFYQAWQACNLAQTEVSELESSVNMVAPSKESSNPIMDDIWQRHSTYPQIARCDAVVAVAMPGFLHDVQRVLGEHDGAAFARDFAFIRNPISDHLDERFEPDHASEMNGVPGTEPCARGRGMGPLRPCELVHALARLDGENLAGAHDNTAVTQNARIDSDILLPVLLVEHRKGTAARYTANWHRLYSCSAVRFLQAVGITDFPVFSLITRGSVGLLFMTWYSSTDEHIYVMERAMSGFDISTPRGAFLYAQFLARLDEHGQKLMSLYSEALPGFLKRLESKPEGWTRAAQDAEGDETVLPPEKQV